MSVINTNYLALVSQNNLSKSQNALGSAIERLSSGLRINSAKDDAAGQAIANRFTANIKGLTQAARNANDGISIAQTTEGALNEINNNLQRVRELSVQAVNGSNSSSDRASIQAEIRQRLDEIDRVSAQTQFNGVNVLARDNTLTIQVGAHDDQVIDVNLKEISSKTLGLSTYTIAGPKNGEATAVNTTALKEYFGDDTALTAATIETANQTALKGAIDTKLGLTTGSAANASIVQDADGSWFAKSTVTVNAADVAKLADLGFAKEDGTAFAAGNTFDVYVAVSPENDAVIATSGTDLEFTVNTDFTAQDLQNSVGSKDPLSALDDALKMVDDLRGELGAVQNRFQSTISNLNNTITNLSSARSRIEDADYAVEVSNMTRAQILQQAGTSVLAKANQVPQGVLSLLQ